MECVVLTAGFTAARVDDCVATNLRKGAGKERMELARIVGGGLCYSHAIHNIPCGHGTVDVESSLGLLAFRTGPRKLT
jgi:hypothetical protein